jgi:5-methyltetrahydropteroyltriglutamate--homocysteine methyltransferase
VLEIASLGYPPIGIGDAVGLWQAGAIDDWRLNAMARTARQAAWGAQRAAGVDLIASGEWGFGDPIADTAAMVGAVPARFGPDIGRAKLEVRLAMAFGSDGRTPERAPWAGTHRSLVVPVLGDDDRWRLSSAHPVVEQLEARSFGITTRPVLVGPISFLLHCRTADGSSPLGYLDRVLPAYREVIGQLRIHGAEWVQLDEPALAGRNDEAVLQAFARAYQQLRVGSAPKLMVVTYGGPVTGAMDVLKAAPIQGLHLDLVTAPDQLATMAAAWPADRVLSLGVVDAVSPAPSRLAAALKLVRDAVERLGPGRLQLAPSLPLTFAPRALDRAPLDHVPRIETAADKLYALRQIADAVVTETDLPDPAITLPDRPELTSTALAG